MSAKLLRFLPRFFRGNKDKDKISTTNKFCNYVEAGTKPGDYICRILLLDDKEVNLAVKVSLCFSDLPSTVTMTIFFFFKKVLVVKVNS